jgi:hypothetical protein
MGGTEGMSHFMPGAWRLSTPGGFARNRRWTQSTALPSITPCALLLLPDRSRWFFSS